MFGCQQVKAVGIYHKPVSGRNMPTIMEAKIEMKGSYIDPHPMSFDTAS